MHSTAPENDSDDAPLDGPPGFAGSSNRVLGSARASSRKRLRPPFDGEMSHMQRLPSSSGPIALPESPSKAIPRIS